MAKKKKRAKTAAGSARKRPAAKHAKGKRSSARRPATRRTATPARRSTTKQPAKRPATRKTPAGNRTAPLTAAAEAARLARNKELVLTLYQALIGDKDFEAARRYMGDTYRQHAPYAADGHDGVRNWIAGFKQAFPEHRYEVKKVIAEGDLVVLHLHGINGPNPHGESVVDIFRIENGKVVEHWDVIQPIPDTADNANSMF